MAEINTKTGESECRYYKERLLYLEEGQKDSLIDSSRVLCCHGELKNNRGVVSSYSPGALPWYFPISIPTLCLPACLSLSLYFYFIFCGTRDLAWLLLLGKHTPPNTFLAFSLLFELETVSIKLPQLVSN